MCGVQSNNIIYERSQLNFQLNKEKIHDSKILFCRYWVIREARQKYPRLGKEKIKPLLDKYCKDNGLKSITESTIANVIKRHNLFFQKAGRRYHNPDSLWAKNGKNRQKRMKVKHSPRPEELGHIVSDTIERITDGIKDYFFSTIDSRGKFA